MATIIKRIVSRGRLLQMADDGKSSEMHQHQFDMAAHMLADGKSVKVYHHAQMGGTVVEYDPEEF